MGVSHRLPDQPHRQDTRYKITKIAKIAKGFAMFLKKRNHAQLMAMQGPPTPPHSDSEVEGEEQKRGGRTDAILAKLLVDFSNSRPVTPPRSPSPDPQDDSPAPPERSSPASCIPVSVIFRANRDGTTERGFTKTEDDTSSSSSSSEEGDTSRKGNTSHVPQYGFIRDTGASPSKHRRPSHTNINQIWVVQKNTDREGVL